MKIRAISFIFKEGLTNLSRNKLMFAASCAIMTAALIILGAFLLVVFIINENVRALDDVPQIQAYCLFSLTDAEADAAEGEVLAAAAGIGAEFKEFHRVSRDEALEIVGGWSEQGAGLLRDIEPDYLPVSFVMRLADPGMISALVEELETIPQIVKINYPKDVIDNMIGISNWVKAFAAVLAGIPILFAVFIISNTIRIAVFERRGEIVIMRYIGATENAIRWPFIVEGVFTGALGAVAAFLATGYGYKLLAGNIAGGAAESSGGLIRLASAGSVTTTLLIIYLIIGAGVGAVGSAGSVNKYLKY